MGDWGPGKWMLWTVLVLGIGPTGLQGQPWTIGNRQIEAEVIDFNGTHVLFQIRGQGQLAVPVSDLNEGDLRRLKDIIELYSMAQAERERATTWQYQQQDLQLQTLEYQKTWTNMWVVQFVAANGQPFYQTYTAPNSMLAMRLARSQYPYARIVFVKKMARKY